MGPIEPALSLVNGRNGTGFVTGLCVSIVLSVSNCPVVVRSARAFIAMTTIHRQQLHSGKNGIIPPVYCSQNQMRIENKILTNVTEAYPA